MTDFIEKDKELISEPSKEPLNKPWFLSRPRGAGGDSIGFSDFVGMAKE